MSKIAFTRITSSSVISKGFRIRGDGIESIKGGEMYSGTAERMEIVNLQELVPIIQSMNTKQAMTYGKVIPDGTRHEIVTKSKQVDGKNISRSRSCFEFKPDTQGLFLVDYDPPKGEQPLTATEVLETLAKVCPAIGKTEKLVISSASSYIYRVSDNTCLKGAGGLHILMRAANAADIPAIGAALDARLWLAGFGRIGSTSDGKKVLRSLIDTSVWQPERLFFESGAYCGTGLIQKRPPFQYFSGNALSLGDVDLPPDGWSKYEDLVNAAKGVTQKKEKTAGKNPAIKRQEREKERAANPQAFIVPVEPMTPAKIARIMGALLHISLNVDYNTWLRIGMALKTSCGDAGFALWDNWSKPSPYYLGSQSLRAKWLSFDRNEVTIKTVYYYARQHGWDSKPARFELPLPVRILPHDQHEPLAKTVCIDDARDQTEDFFNDVILDPQPFTVSAAQITVGVGKTSTLKRLFQNITKAGKKVTIVAKDKKQCAAYEEAGAFWRHGRECSPMGFGDAWHCPKAEEGGNVQRLAEKEQRLHQMCRGGHCEHGNAAALANAKRENREPDEKVIRFFRERPELAGAEPCGWFDHMSESQSYDIRVVTSAGLALTDMLDDMRNDVDVLVVDESLSWGHSQFLDGKGIRKNIERLQELRKKLPDDSKENEILEIASQVFAELSEKLGKQAGTAPAGEYQAVEFDMADIANQLSKLTDEHGVAVWEKPQWKQWTDLVQSPLRALSAIKDGIKANSLSIVDGQLHITYLHPILEIAMQKGIAVVILDATLDSTAQSIASTVKHIVAAPNLEYVCDPRWFISAKNDEEAMDREMAKLLKVRAKLERKTGRRSYVICRMALAHYMIAKLEKLDENDLRFMPRDELWDLSIICGIGWWGWHDAAHDEWNGRDGLLWGQMPTPDHIRIQQYADHRAALMLLGVAAGANLPLPNYRWLDDQEVITGNCAQTSQARLPEQPEVREWLLKHVANQRIQAAGRSRAVCQMERMTIWQCGGYPVTGLAEHGIRPTYDRLVDGLSGDEIAALHSAQRHELMNAAAALAIASGRQVTRDSVREFTSTLCNSLIANKSNSSQVVRDRYIYIYQHRTTSSELEANGNNKLEQVLFTNDAGTWNDEYTAWRKTVHAGIRLHFAEHAGSVDDMPMPTPAQEPVSVPVEANEPVDSPEQWDMDIIDISAPDDDDSNDTVEVMPDYRKDIQEPDWMTHEHDDEYAPGADG